MKKSKERSRWCVTVSLDRAEWDVLEELTRRVGWGVRRSGVARSLLVGAMMGAVREGWSGERVARGGER